MGTADARGIGCAVLARVPVLASHVHTSPALPVPGIRRRGSSPFGDRIPLRRGIVHVRIDAGAIGAIDLFVAHFKSNRALPLKDACGEPIAPRTGRDFAEGHIRSATWRAAEALFVRGLVDDVCVEDPARHVVVAGDLNDHASRRRSCASSAGEGRTLSSRVPTRCRRPPGTASSIRGRSEQIDHILTTQALRKRLQSSRFLTRSSVITEPSRTTSRSPTRIMRRSSSPLPDPSPEGGAPRGAPLPSLRNAFRPRRRA